MTSLMKSFLRRDSVPEGRTDFNRTSSGLASSPSFNDFSMGLNVSEADTELTTESCCATPTTRGPGWLARLSSDSQASVQSQVSMLSGLESPYARSPHAVFPSPFTTAPSPAQQLHTEARYRQRFSMDSQLGYKRSLSSGTSGPASERRSYERSSSVAIPVARQSVPEQPATAPPRREGKIDGMDYYEFCELIRSSSL